MTNNLQFTIFNFQFRSRKGFTLIELLIVVAIISILSTLLMVNFIAVRQRGRDAQRKSDLRQIQSALELYRADQDTYPTPPNQNSSIGELCNSLYQISGDASCPSSKLYMKKVPTDPNRDPSNPSGWYNNGYYFYSSDGNTYSLAACIENTSDKDSNASVTAPSGSPSGCTGLYYVLQNP